MSNQRQIKETIMNTTANNVISLIFYKATHKYIENKQHSNVIFDDPDCITPKNNVLTFPKYSQ